MSTKNIPNIASKVIHNLALSTDHNALVVCMNVYGTSNVPTYRLPPSFSALFNMYSNSAKFHSMMSIIRVIMQDCDDNMPARLDALEQYAGVTSKTTDAVATYMCYESPLALLRIDSGTPRTHSLMSGSMKLISMAYTESGQNFSMLISLFIEWYCVFFGISGAIKHDFYTEIFKRITWPCPTNQGM